MWISSARPGVTLSRLSFVVASLSFVLLFWNYGLPQYSPTSRISGQGEETVAPTPAPFFIPATFSNSYAAATTYPESATGTSASEEINAPESSPSPSSVSPFEPSAISCSDAKGAEDVMVVLKTSAVEIYEKLPEHLLTLFRCTPHYAIFSDLQGVVAGQNIYDALENVTAETREKQKEFEHYKKIQQYGAEWQQFADLKGEGTKALDKWKFLPMVYKSYKVRPQAKFFVFIEADTSLSWTNLLQWVNRLDSRIPYYAGAPSNVSDIRFAQRGGGFLLSKAAAELYATAYEQKYVSKWEKMTAGECCGDVALALGLNNAHVEFYSAFPLLQGETPASLDWTKRHWCVPVVSWHHMSPNEIDILWNFQQEWVKRNVSTVQSIAIVSLLYEIMRGITIHFYVRVGTLLI